jgi:hypothetical protein
MTEDKIALRALLEKGSDATFLREMIGFAAERLMQLETEGLCGAAPGERTADRRNHRNGYRERDWETRAGTVEYPSWSRAYELPVSAFAQQCVRQNNNTAHDGVIATFFAFPAFRSRW